MKKIWFVVLLVLALVLLGASVSAATPPPGCNGTVKTHDGNGEPSPIEKDHPKVCTFHLHGFNFDPGSTVNWHIDQHPGGGEVLSGSLTVDGGGRVRTGLFSLPNGMYKLYWHQEGCPGGDKHKVFKVECPVCEEFDTHYGQWSDWSDWSKCINGEQKRTRTREVWTTDVNDPSIECDRWTEKETQTQWCDLCEEVDTHYGEWGPWSEWSKCTDGKKSRTRTREVWETDINHPEVECDRWTETETQTIDCDLCVEVDTHYGEWSDWSDWSKCINGKQKRTRTREVWETDINHPEVECDRWTETETQTRDCEEPEPVCWDKCKKKGDCPEGLECIGGHCVNAKCPEQRDCICPVAPAGCNKEPTEAGCKGDLVPYVLPDGRIVCRNSGCLEEPTCICTPPACYPRLNIYALDCVPEGLVISGYFKFDEDNYDGPSGSRYINKPWEKNPFIVDLKKGYVFRFFGWTAEGGFVYFFDTPPIRRCPKVIDKEHRFPCPEPTPTPPPVEELPVTGVGPPPPTLSLPDLRVVGLALMVLGGILRRRY